MRKKWITGVVRCAAGSLLILPLAASAAVNLVADGGFEIPPVPATFTTVGPGPLGAWTVAAGSVDLIGGYWQPAGGSESLDAAGLQNGTIKQSINVPTTGSYLLTFAMSGNPDGPPPLKELAVSFNGGLPTIFSYNTLTEGNTHSDMKWQGMALLVNLSAGTTVLQFQDVTLPSGDPNFPGTTPWGAALDEVSLTAVPEPTTMIAGALLLLPFGASTLRILRAKRVA